MLPLLTSTINGVQFCSFQSIIMCSTTARWLFWSDSAAGKIHRSRLDGSNDITVIADDVTSPQGLVVDSRMKRYVFYRHQNKLETHYHPLHWPSAVMFHTWSHPLFLAKYKPTCVIFHLKLLCHINLLYWNGQLVWTPARGLYL